MRTVLAMVWLLCIFAAVSSPVTASESELETNIIATDPDTRRKCMDVIRERRSPWAQYEQDTFIWHNYLRHLGNNRTYVDVGAYAPEQISNTAFLDLCLGWRGLCVEMNDKRRPLFEESQRTCKFVAACVSDGHYTTKMLGSQEINPWSAEVLDSAHASDSKHHREPDVQCRPLASILAEHSMFDVSFMSLDIEGQELRALSVFPFEKFNIETLVLESVHVPNFALNYLMTMNGYRMEQQLAIDSFFVKRTFQLPDVSMPHVYPARWEYVWQHEVRFRCEDMHQCSAQQQAFFNTLGRVEPASLRGRGIQGEEERSESNSPMQALQGHVPPSVERVLVRGRQERERCHTERECTRQTRA